MLTTAFVLFFAALAFQGSVIIYLTFKNEAVRPTLRSLPFFLLLAACVATVIHIAEKIPENVFDSVLKIISAIGG